MAIMDRLVELINRDTIQQNESKKMAVIIRTLTLFTLCFLVVICGFCAINSIKYGVVTTLMSFAVYTAVFGLTYRLEKRYSVGLFILVTVAWCAINLWVFGWFCGVQTIVFQMILIYFFATYGRLAHKLVFCVLIFGTYMSLYFVFSHKTPMNELSDMQTLFIRTVFVLLVIVSMATVCYLFSNESQNMESKLVEYNKKLEKKSSTDPLTGLYNRGKAMEILTGLESKANTDTFSMCICDIDFFKKVNDNYGHDVGDKVLIEVAGVLSRMVKEYGYVARWGGEEFMIIFPRTNGDDASTVIYAIQSEMRRMAVKNGDDEIKVTLTYGLTEFDSHLPLDQNIKDADNKLYRGKEEGRNMLVY